MVNHAMRYVAMGEKVLRSLDPAVYEEADAIGLARAIEGIIEAESALVTSYGTWRDAILILAEQGSPEARRALDRTTWDLT